MSDRISLFIFFIFYFLGLFINNPNFSYVGYFSTLILVGFIFLNLLLSKKIYLNRKIFFSIALVFLAPIFLMFYYDFFYNTLNLSYFYINFQFFVIFVIFVFGFQFRNNVNLINFLVKVIILLLVIMVPFFGGGSILAKENVFSSIILILFSFILYAEKRFLYIFFYAGLTIFAILYADARSSLLALFLMLLLYVGYNFFIKFYKVVFLLSFILALSWIFIIVFLYNTGLGDGVNEYLNQISGKRLYSGREKMWGDFVAHISNAPILGYGLGMDYNVISGEDYSTHNVYLATLMQQGLLGLLILLYALWHSFNVSIREMLLKGRKSLAFILVPPILLQQNFELSLTQNSMSFMIIFWFFLGVSIKLRNDY